MKIQRYKGPNREALYQAIHEEMGPSAVVVAPKESSGWNGAGRTGNHELIAILEEPKSSPSEPPPPAGGTDLGEEIQRQWRQTSSALREIHQSISTLRASAKDDTESVPPHARDWDPRFRTWARSSQPHLLDPKTPPSRERLTAALKERLSFETAFPFRKPGAGPHTIVLVGPTGSGKTTTLAKLAAICALQEGLRIGLITTDTFRVAAVDQIREYASLLDSEIHVVFSETEARAAVKTLADVDVILVDTPGRTHLDDIGLASIHKILRGMGPTSVFLTLPATLNHRDLGDILKGFSRFQPDHLIVTKVDETRCPALFTTLPFNTDRSIAFVTNGQQVPKDIFAATPSRIAALLTDEAESAPPTPRRPKRYIPDLTSSTNSRSISSDASYE